MSDTLATFYEKLDLPDEILEFFGCTVTEQIHAGLIKAFGMSVTAKSSAYITSSDGPPSVAEWWRSVGRGITLPQMKAKATDLQLATEALVGKSRDKYRALFYFVAGLTQALDSARPATELLPMIRQRLADFELGENVLVDEVWYGTQN